MNSRILPSIAIMISLGVFFVYVNPLWTGSIAKIKAEIASDNLALAAAHVYMNQQNELATARNAIDPKDLEKLERFLPNSIDNVGIILDLDALASKSGLSLSNINIASDSGNSSAISSSASSPIGSVDLSLSAVGTYSAFKTFLDSVEKSERLLDVIDLDIKGSDTGVYTYQIKLRLYWLR